MTTPTDDRWIWLDLEMTGLEPEKDRILEIATLVTDIQLNILAEGPVIAIKQSDAMLKGMDEWCTKQHTQSGLVKRVQESQYNERQAEQETLEFLKRYVKSNTSPICGNSICQDRRFLAKYMPELNAFFHYRHLDVSSVKILAQRWAPKVADSFTKESRHLALNDIKDSIDELNVYREAFFK